MIQGDPEPSVRQVLNAFQACRTKLGLDDCARNPARLSRLERGSREGRLNDSGPGADSKGRARKPPEGRDLRAHGHLRVAAQAQQFPAQQVLRHQQGPYTVRGGSWKALCGKIAGLWRAVHILRWVALQRGPAVAARHLGRHQ